MRLAKYCHHPTFAGLTRPPPLSYAPQHCSKGATGGSAAAPLLGRAAHLRPYCARPNAQVGPWLPLFRPAALPYAGLFLRQPPRRDRSAPLLRVDLPPARPMRGGQRRGKRWGGAGIRVPRRLPSRGCVLKAKHTNSLHQKQNSPSSVRLSRPVGHRPILRAPPLASL